MSTTTLEDADNASPPSQDGELPLRFMKPGKRPRHHKVEKKVTIRCPVGDETKWIVPKTVSVDVDNAKETFLLFDTQHMGYFTEADVQLFFGADNERYTEFVDRFDGNRDGQVTFLEFRATLDEYVEKKVELSWWERVFVIFSEPSSCVLAKWISVFIIVLIIISTVSFVLETETSLYRGVDDAASCCEDVLVVDQLDDDLVTLYSGGAVCPCPPEPLAWFGVVESICIYCFSIEYLIRVGTVWNTPFGDTFDMVLDVSSLDENLWHWWLPFVRWKNFIFNPMNLIDLCAIVPFYVSLFMGGEDSGFGFLRVLRLARVFRVFKMGKYNAGMQMFTKVIIKSSSALNLLCFFALLGMVLFGSLVYFFEGGEFKVTASYPDGAYMRVDKYGDWDVTPFESIPSCFWWVVVTQTTVGYGDATPITPGGKLIGCFTMLSGVLVLALPITIIGANFASEYQRSIAEEKRNVAKEREALAKEIAAARIRAANNTSDSPISKMPKLSRRLSSFTKRRSSMRVMDDPSRGKGKGSLTAGRGVRSGSMPSVSTLLEERSESENSEDAPPPPIESPPGLEPMSPMTPSSVGPSMASPPPSSLNMARSPALPSPASVGSRKYLAEPPSPNGETAESRQRPAEFDLGLLVARRMVQVTATVHSYQDKHRLTDVAGEALIRELTEVVDQIERKEAVAADELMRTLNMCWNWIERSCADEGVKINKREKQLLFKAVLDLITSAIPVAPDNFN